MTTKPIELTIEERNTLCHVLGHVMEMLSNTRMTYHSTAHKYMWNTPADKQEYDELRDLREKLKPKTVQKSGYVLKERLPGEVWTNPPPEEINNFQLITWEEQQ